MIKKSLLLSLMFLTLPALAAAPFTPEQEARIKELIRETLVQNPAILAEAADAFDKEAAKQQQSVVAQMVKKTTMPCLTMRARHASALKTSTDAGVFH